MGNSNLEFVTFRVGGMLMGVGIQQVEEINRNLNLTPVPHSLPSVRGVVNLRGEVVTVVDLRTVLGLSPATTTRETRIVIVNSDGERIGLLVDMVADVVTCEPDAVESPPANVSGVDGRFFRFVCKLEKELLIVLDVRVALSAEEYSAPSRV